jgi:hypothetical protein
MQNGAFLKKFESCFPIESSPSLFEPQENTIVSKFCAPYLLFIIGGHDIELFLSCDISSLSSSPLSSLL